MLLFNIVLLALTSAVPSGSLTAVRTETAPEIDGVLDEAVWDRIDGETCELWQFAPDYGSEMTQPTTMKIIYDDSSIYFGFVMYDSLPDRMVDALTPRDNYINGEWIAILLDTWCDGRSAFSFEVSLANSQMDSRLNGHGNWDYGWDAVWESGTARLENGWSAEFAIPLSCLRFPDCSEQEWSVNFQRILSRTSENGWYMLSESQQMADLTDFAVLDEISGIEGSLGMEIRPYVAGKYFEFQTLDQDEFNGDAGLDLKMGLSSGITADFTLNPDFGQVEADEAEMNLSHFELFLQEKRPFFMERRELFDMPFNLFYSRRIGAVGWNGDLVPIVGGAKITGSAGPYRFGFIDAVTGRVWEDDTTLVEAGANYGVFRGIRELGGYNYLAMSAVVKDSWEQEGLESETNRGAAFDGAYELPGGNLISGGLAGSWNTDADDGMAWRMSLEKVRSTLGYWAGFRQVDDNFDVNATGFTTETNYRSSWAGARKTFRPENTFATFSIMGGYDYRNQIDGEVLEQSGNGEINGTFKNGWNFTLQTDVSGEHFDPYEGPEGHFYPGAVNYFAGGGSNPFLPLSFWAGTGGGEFDSRGTFSNFTGRMRYRPVPVLEASISGDWFRTFDTEKFNWELEDFDLRSTEWRSVTVRLAYMFNPEMNLRLFSQYSDFNLDYQATGESESNQIRSNLLFSWQYLPGSMLYVLGETVFDGDGNGSFEDPDYGIYAKLTWFLPI